MRAERPEKCMGVGGEGGWEREDIFDPKMRGSGGEGIFDPKLLLHAQELNAQRGPERPREA